MTDDDKIDRLARVVGRIEDALTVAKVDQAHAIIVGVLANLRAVEHTVDGAVSLHPTDDVDGWDGFVSDLRDLNALTGAWALSVAEEVTR